MTVRAGGSKWLQGNLVFRLLENCTHELTAVAVAHVKPVQEQARQKSNLEWGGGHISLLAEE